MPLLKRRPKLNGSDREALASGEVARPCAPAIEDQDGYRDGTEWGGMVEPESVRMPEYTVEDPEANPDAFSEQAALASVLARHLRTLSNVDSDNVEQLSSRLAEIALGHLAHLAELRSKGTPVQTVRRSNSIWWSRCPRGHLTDEFLWLHQCVGIICSECLSIYEPQECHLEPRLIMPGNKVEFG
jgi:hypothetical protein